MNRGEGLRNASKAKSGNIQMFQEPKKTKPKKFGYKSKTQSHAVRKNIIDDGNQHAGKTTGSKPTGQQKQTKSNQQQSNQRNGIKPGVQKEKPRTSFVDKNKNAHQANERTRKGADTVTLTQDQLNAILKTIGTAGESAGNTSFSIDGGNLKVNVEPNNDNAANKNETIDKLFNNVDNHDRHNSKNHHDPPSTNIQDDNNNHAPTRVAASEERIQEQKQSSRDMVGHGTQQSPRGGQSDILNTIGVSEQNDKSLMEKKRQQWKQELDAQLAEKKAAQEREGKGRRVRNQPADNSGVWNPWGQPGGGAPMTKTTPRDNQVYVAQPSPGRGSRGQGPSDVLSQSTSGLGHIDGQRNVPAAMRSSFIFGAPTGNSTNDHSSDLKRREKEEWRQELANQKREAEERKRQEKANQRKADSAVMQHWAEPVDVPPSHRAPRMESRIGKVQDDIGVMSRVVAERVEPTAQPKSAPHTSSRSPPTTDDLSPRMHIRPANALLDPAEIERRENQRKKHLEHIAAVQAQVEEKQRKKREALESRRAEEAEEERRLAEERDRLAQDFEREREKQRKKEEAAAAKQRTLIESMNNAHEAAMREKHQGRMRKLQRQGHDVTNLRKSWDAEEHRNPVVSPRLPAQAVVSHQQPPPMATTSVNFSPRHGHGPAATVAIKPETTISLPAGIQDASTSPINEVSTQTEIGVLDANYISPRLIEAIRLATAGAEYKPKGRKHGDREEKQEPSGGRKKRDKVVKVASTQEESSDNSSRRSSNASKPKWGQVVNKKKITKNSDKDMSMSKRKREERLKKRQEELLALQEKNAPKRMTQAKQKRVETKSEDNERKGRKSRTDTRLLHNADEKENKHDRVKSRRDVPVSRHEGAISQQSRKDIRPSSSEDSYLSSETPPYNGDFIPFMRTGVDELRADSVSVSPVPARVPSKQSHVQQQVPPEMKEAPARVEAGARSRQSRQSHREMDPLLNPDRLKDKELRQEEILVQLSNLRQGLLMKQREMEIGLPPSSPGII